MTGIQGEIMDSQYVIEYLRKMADPEMAVSSQRFFKTGRGEYAEGDLFWGIRVPVLRKLVKEFKLLDRSNIMKLLKSEFHEVRLLALFIMVEQFSKGGTEIKESIYTAYINNTKYINNWDLVDSSAYQIAGTWLLDKDRSQLYDFAKSHLLWERRISIISTFYFIRHNQYQDTLQLASILLNDSEELMHKAIGWMLREVGKKDRPTLEDYLQVNYQNMPRTTLRYAIERFDPIERRAYLKGRK